MKLRWATYKFELLLLFHLVLGAVFGYIPGLIIVWVLGALLLFGILPLLYKGNLQGRAHLVAAYLAGFEITVRAARVGLPHEMTKYAVILLLGMGLFGDAARRPKPYAMLAFFALLLPSILVMDGALDAEQLRQGISFNLSGPLCLALSAWYFYLRPMSKEELARVFKLILYGIATTLGYLFVRTPSVRELTFTHSANFEASDYGPNQMSSMLGYGILIIVTVLLLKLPVFRLRLALWALLGLLLFRGLLTFSRGGLAGPLIAILLATVDYLYATGFWRLANIKRLVAFALLGGLGFGVFSYVNALSGNVLYERFTGKRGREVITLERYTSGRTKIFEIDLAIFNDHPVFGIGPGMGNDVRVKYGYGERSAAHIEFSRLLAEHGLLGVFALLILLFFPLKEFLRRRQPPERRFLLIALTLSTFAFMSHSATRIALPMFMYGLGFVWLTETAVRQQIRSSAESPSLITKLPASS